MELDPDYTRWVSFRAAREEVPKVLIVEVGDREIAGGQQAPYAGRGRMWMYAHALAVARSAKLFPLRPGGRGTHQATESGTLQMTWRGTGRGVP